MMEGKYKKIENFVSQDVLDLLKNYCKITHRINCDEFDTQPGHTTTGYYGHPIMEALMIKQTKKISEIVGKKVMPTYSYWRSYTMGDILPKHKDRPECEYSVTLMIDSCGTEWPIYLEGTPINLKPGDGIVYKGCEAEHWRKTFTGDYHAQCFLHYYDPETNKEAQAVDGRALWGMKKPIMPI